MTLQLSRTALLSLPLTALLLSSAGAALAERADSFKQVIIDARSGTANEVTQTRTLVGDVVLSRGTLLVKAGRAVIKTNPQGDIYATFYADPGGLATFRQKRDGGDIWDQGEAERIEYDNRAEVVKMFSKAKVATLENKRKTQEVQGPYLSYDSRKEVYSVENDVSGTTKSDGGRVRMIIEPKVDAAPAGATASPPPPAIKVPTPVAPAKKP